MTVLPCRPPLLGLPVLFSSTLFLLLALPLVMLVYHLLPHLLRNTWLLLISLVFYAWGEPRLLWVMLASMAGNYLLGLWMGRVYATPRAKAVLAVAVTANLASLAWFKYAGWMAVSGNHLLQPLGLQLPVPQVVLPLGISFYTFHALSYVVDVYRGDAKVQRDPTKIALYLALYPQLIAGPILRYHDMADQLGRRQVRLDDLAYGLQRFVLGLAKKVLIANTLARPADALFALPHQELSAPLAWLAVVAYTGQIYFDFSGYSDMAVGLARMHGFVFTENFRWPYAAQDVRGFWRRWHISLSNWFRDYLYIPLGGNRASEGRTRINLLIVFLLCGLWHGAAWTFVAWGLWHGAFLALERTAWGTWLPRLPRPLRHTYALLVAMLGWVLFRAETFEQATGMVVAMAGMAPGDTTRWSLALYLGRDVQLGLVVGAVASQPVLPWLGGHWQRWRSRGLGPAGQLADGLLQAGTIAALLLLLVASAVMLAAATHNPFIYFRF